MATDPNDNKLMTKRIQASDRTTVILSYTKRDALALRELAYSITLKAGKRPSLSLISRRSLQLYSQILSNPTHREAEIQALNTMVTPVPTPAPYSKKAYA